MTLRIAHISLLVHDYDDAIMFFTGKLGFHLVEDTKLNEAKRWVLVSPPGSKGCNLLLAKAANDQQKEIVGKQAGGRVFLFLYTEDFERDYTKMVNNGVRFVRKPKTEPYGKVAVFEDLYGNLWDLLEPNDSLKLDSY